MTSSPATRLNIPVMHSLKLWIGETGMGKSWAQDPGLVSNVFTNIDKSKMRIKYNNLCSPAWWMGGCCVLDKIHQ